MRPGPIRRGSTFRFLNRDGAVDGPADWDSAEQPKLWLYNLHYFDWLREQAAANRVSEDAAWLDRWIADNPGGRGTGWEPYPLSLRVVNWTVWLHTIGRADAARLASLAAQARYLAGAIEYHLLGNHLFVNAKALVFAGTFFAGPEADRWRTIGLDILRRELPEQILADGGHFELSPMYHALILEDVLDLLGLAAAYPNVLAQPAASLGLAEVAARMTAWLACMAHPDGEIAYFNDSAFGIAPPPQQLFAYATVRGVEAPAPAGRISLLRASGYAVLSAPPFHAVVDCARVGPDYLPGHAHADTLSFELSISGARLISNSGTSTYAAGPDRAWERSTSAHATVQIDGVDSAETWASFRVGRRPNVGPIETGTEGEANWIACRHDGYRHLAGAPVHERRVTVDSGSVHIMDRIAGGGSHAAVGRLPIHPGVRVEQTGGRAFRLVTPETAVDLSIEGDVTAALQSGHFASGFGLTVERPVVTWQCQGNLPLVVQTQFRVTAA